MQTLATKMRIAAASTSGASLQKSCTVSNTPPAPAFCGSELFMRLDSSVNLLVAEVPDLHTAPMKCTKNKTTAKM